MILSIVAVGDLYIDKTFPCLDRFIQNGYDVKILTDQPERFSNAGVDVYHYNKKIFSYFDKIIFPLQLSEKYRTGVLYIDADMLCELTNEFVQTFTGSQNFLYYKTWPHGETFKDYKHDGYFKILLDYFYNKKITKYDHLIAILEWVFYFPYLEEKTVNLLVDIERIKPVFEYMSTIIDPGYRGIGNAEGLALSYVLDKNQTPIEKFGNLIFKI